MTDQQHQPQLKVGGTLNPRRHIYIERPEDDELLALLLDREYCNILASRQMGKSSLMARTSFKLAERGVRFAVIDVAGELGGTSEPELWYLGLLEKIARELDLELAIECWWQGVPAGTHNQKLLRFFREVVAQRVTAPVVVFLDEIDSTLRLPFTDDLFTALRTMYNERPFEEAYDHITFCLLGVATPNELVKDRRTTAYNVGRTLELRDFDEARDDLSPLVRVLSDDPERGRAILRKTLYWTGGHPYLTLRFCEELRRSGRRRPGDVDAYVEEAFTDLDRLSSDVHFQQVQRFLENRVSDGFGTLRLYERILEGKIERSQATVLHTQLQLSGLVKRNTEGRLAVRNRLYGRLFNRGWVLAVKPKRDLGPYEIELKVAATGTGAVYRAYNKALGRWVALKHIRHDAEDSIALERLWRGARAIASLSHPTIVKIYDIAETDEGLWIVMEWVDGRSLSSLVTERSLTVDLAVTLVHDVAQGLAVAHAASIMHRNLSLESIMVTAEGRAKILDFGLAKMILESRSEDEITATAVPLSELRFLTPEQAEFGNAAVDTRADLFLLGVLCYELVTGQHPFGDSHQGVVMWIDNVLLKQQKTAIEINPAVPQELSNLIDRLLEKKAEDRPQSAEEVLEALGNLRIIVSKEPSGRDRPQVELSGIPGPGSETTVPSPVTGEGPTLQRDQQIGSYRIVERVGRGGMGTVYLAVREDSGQQVALKVIHRAVGSGDVVSRFRREMHILALLDHPNIARLLDSGTTDDGLFYFVMEYIEGERLDRFCDSRNLTIRERLELFRGICSAVQFAHRNLVVHRDLKPSNILVTPEGVPKLLDFGIATLLEPQLASKLDDGSEVGAMTLRYASPEQVQEGPITTASDVYTLGVLLYELLTGRSFYPKELSTAQLIVSLVEGHRPKPSSEVRQNPSQELSHTHGAGPREIARSLDGDLDSMILMALRKDPENRYRSAEQLSEDIRLYLEGLPVLARDGSDAYRIAKLLRRHPWWTAAATVGLLLILLATILFNFIDQKGPETNIPVLLDEATSR